VRSPFSCPPWMHTVATDPMYNDPSFVESLAGSLIGKRASHGLSTVCSPNTRMYHHPTTYCAVHGSSVSPQEASPSNRAHYIRSPGAAADAANRLIRISPTRPGAATVVRPPAVGAGRGFRPCIAAVRRVCLHVTIVLTVSCGILSVGVCGCLCVCLCGYVWVGLGVFVGVCGCLWLSMVVYGCLWLLMVVCGDACVSSPVISPLS
jgi:hypothetical protein